MTLFDTIHELAVRPQWHTPVRMQCSFCIGLFSTRYVFPCMRHIYGFLFSDPPQEHLGYMWTANIVSMASPNKALKPESHASHGHMVGPSNGAIGTRWPGLPAGLAAQAADLVRKAHGSCLGTRLGSAPRASLRAGSSSNLGLNTFASKLRLA